MQSKNVNNNSSKISIFGIFSIIFSLIGVFYLGFIFGTLAIISGVIGIIQSSKGNGAYKWMSVLGLVIGAADVILTFVHMLIAISTMM